uniref:Uncharacterized protein n=1 Tax=Ditylenchus dipsaci TaxID=166011 RepID=A0A915ESW6_9BILA
MAVIRWPISVGPGATPKPFALDFLRALPSLRTSGLDRWKASSASPLIGIDSGWNKFVLRVRHNFESISEIVSRMLEEWQIEKQQQTHHPARRRFEMKKRRYLDGDCGAQKLNLVVKKLSFQAPEIKSMLDSCRKLIRRFTHSTLARIT